MTSDKENYKGEKLTRGTFLPTSPLGLPGGSVVKNLPASVVEMRVQYLGWEDPLEKEMVTHSSILARRIRWTEEPGGPLSMELQRAGHD